MLDYDLKRALVAAWWSLLPRLQKDPGELSHRLARRRSTVLTRPPRAWCLAVRACDRRITLARFKMSHAPERWDATNHRRLRVEHDVLLDARNLAWLCRPVFVPKPGLDARDLADLLGLNPSAIHRATRRGLFSVHYVKGLSGKKGPPVPVVYTDKLLDPAGFPLGQLPNHEWGTLHRYAADHIPPTLSQLLTRIPLSHPNGLPHTTSRGWRWICPACKHPVRRVFYPLPPLLQLKLPVPPPSINSQRLTINSLPHDPNHPDAFPLPPATFACVRCHQIKDYGRLNAQGWNQLVSHLSAGLLFGHEVQRPAWYTPTRKRAFAPRPNRVGKRTLQITHLIAHSDLTYAQIEQRLGMPRGHMCGWVSYIFKKHKVHSREELRRKCATDQHASSKTAG